jgi:hypothetical protein
MTEAESVIFSVRGNHSRYQATMWDSRPTAEDKVEIEEDGSVIYLYKCYWALPVLSLLGSIPAELEAISYCLI